MSAASRDNRFGSHQSQPPSTSRPVPARPGSGTATTSSHASTPRQARSNKSPPVPPAASPLATVPPGQSAAYSTGTYATKRSLVSTPGHGQSPKSLLPTSAPRQAGFTESEPGRTLSGRSA